MKAAPYTRDTLTRIRNGATAAELGWDAQFYSTVCRRHEIVPNVYPTPLIAIHTPVAQQRAELFTAVDVAKRLATGGIIFDPVNGEVHRGQSVVMLTRLCADCFHLFAKTRSNILVTGDELGRRLGISREAAVGRIGTLRVALRRVHLTIDSVKGPGGGFRLIDVLTGDAAAVEILRPQDSKAAAK